jgi:hypothetical protein
LPRNNNNNNNNNKLQLGYHPVAVVILHVHKYENSPEERSSHLLGGKSLKSLTG